MQAFLLFSLGNIVKAILDDFEGVKKNISSKGVGSKTTFRKKVGESIATIRTETGFRLEISKIEKKLQTPLTFDEQNVIENQVQFLKFMIKLENIIKQAESVKSGPVHDRKTSSLETSWRTSDHELELMKSELEDLLQWVMKYRMRFSEQELEEFNEELQRAHLMFSYLALSLEIRKRKIGLSAKETRYMAYVKEKLDPGTKLSKLVSLL